MELWNEEFVCEIIFWRHCCFDSSGDVINSKLGLKGPKLVSHVPMVMERWKSKVKGTFRAGVCLLNFFLEIFKSKPHVVTSSSQNWVKDTQFVYHVQLAVKRWKSGHIIALVHSKKKFWWKTFWILKHWSSLWHHYSNLSKSPYRSGFNLSTINCIWYISFVSFWVTLILLSPFAQNMQILAFFDPILAIMTSELELKF